jgi:hypothetical protein
LRLKLTAIDESVVIRVKRLLSVLEYDGGVAGGLAAGVVLE